MAPGKKTASAIPRIARTAISWPYVLTAAVAAEIEPQMITAQQMYMPGLETFVMRRLLGIWKRQIPDEEDRNRGSELLGGHVEIVGDALQLRRGQVLAVDVVQDIQDSDRRQDDEVHLADELFAEAGDLDLSESSKDSGIRSSAAWNCPSARDTLSSVWVSLMASMAGFVVEANMETGPLRVRDAIVRHECVRP